MEDEDMIAPRFDAAEHDTYDEADVRSIRMDTSFPDDFRQDENAVFLARQLDYVRSRVYTRKYPTMKGNVLVPVSTEIPEWAEVVKQRVYDEVGMAKIISNYADDLPRADVRAKEMQITVHTIGNSFGYNVNELRASRHAGVGLDTARGAAARRATEEKLNRISLLGDSDYGLFGLLNHPNIPEILTLNGNWTDAATTGQMILDDLNNMYIAYNEQNFGVHEPNFIAMTARARQAATTKMIDGALGRTAWQMFAEQHPNIVVESIYEFRGAGANGGDLLMMYERSEENLRHELVMAFNQLPAQVRNLETVVPCMARTAGVQIDYPMAFLKAEI